jgi:hypothetical protein
MYPLVAFVEHEKLAETQKLKPLEAVNSGKNHIKIKIETAASLVHLTPNVRYLFCYLSQ